VLLGSVLLALAALLLTLSTLLPLVLLGLALFTVGFFAAHTSASGMVGRRATTGRAQASALYLLAYYAGSSLGGWAGGLAYERRGVAGRRRLRRRAARGRPRPGAAAAPHAAARGPGPGRRRLTSRRTARLLLAGAGRLQHPPCHPGPASWPGGAPHPA
jgi:hypothetical protein